MIRFPVTLNDYALDFFHNITFEPTGDQKDLVADATLLFDNAVDTLRNPAQMPNPAVCKLATLLRRLVGNRVTPCALVQARRSTPSASWSRGTAPP